MMSEPECRILIADDDAEILESSKRAFLRFTKRNFQVHVIQSWGDLVDPAADIHKEPPFDVAIFDLGFPSDNRFSFGDSKVAFPELIVTFTNLTPRGMKVVYSGYSEMELVRQAFLYGAADYLLKVQTIPASLPKEIDRLLTRQEDFQRVLQWTESQPGQQQLRTRWADPRFHSATGPVPPAATGTSAIPQATPACFFALITDSNHQVEIKAIGCTALEALLRYTQNRTTAGEEGKSWPREPFLHCIHSDELSEA
jgi:DNA-binding NarL/FixJ family response regulator